MDQNELGWNMAANLRWLSEQDHRPGRVPCGELTGVFLKKCADRLESLATRPKGDELLERLTRREKKRVRYGGPATARDYHSVLVNPDGIAAALEIERLRSELTALTQAPRSCCAEERERCAKIADKAEAEADRKLQAAKTEKSRRNYAAASVAARYIARAIRTDPSDTLIEAIATALENGETESQARHSNQEQQP